MKSIPRLLRILKPYRGPIALTLLLLAGTIATDLATPRLIQSIIDQGIKQKDLKAILTISSIMVGLTLISVALTIGNMLLAVRISQRASRDLRRELFAHVQSLSFADFDRLPTGRLMTRLSSDITQIAQFVLMTMRMFVRAPIMFVGSVILLFVTDARVAWIVLALVPAITAVFVLYATNAQPLFLEAQRRLDRLSVIFQENLAGVRVVKAYVRADHENRRFAAANSDLTERTIAVGRMLSFLLPSLRFLVNLGLVAVVWFGGSQAIRGTLTVGRIVALNNYLFWLMTPLVNVSMSIGFISGADASMQRVFEVMDTRPRLPDGSRTLDRATARGRVAFENVSFAYGGQSKEPVLQGINLVAEPGQRVALVGTTGAGKSTLVNLVPRFYDVTGGRVTFDGVDVRDFRLDSLRAQVGAVLQDTVLFSGTIRDNIRYGRPNATDEEVIAAARAAQAHDFVMGFPKGYDTVVGQRGVNLSGGQKQRLAIARALLVQPLVLITDDSTSSVDVQTEARIQEALRPMMAGRTTFIVAQRISSVLTADKIVVLDRGAIAASGTHAELMASSPIYREIYESQLGTARET